MKNKYSANSKISEMNLLEIVRLFAFDLTVSQIAALLRLNRNTVSRYVNALRRRIAENSPYGQLTVVQPGNLQVKQIEGVRGRNPSEKHAIVLLFEDNSKVFAALVPRHLVALMQAIMRGKVRADGVMEAISLQECRAIGDLNTKKLIHLVAHQTRISGATSTLIASPVDRFWSDLRQRMVKCRGIKREVLPLHLCECAFRFNNRHDIHKRLLELIELKPLF